MQGLKLLRAAHNDLPDAPSGASDIYGIQYTEWCFHNLSSAHAAQIQVELAMSDINGARFVNVLWHSPLIKPSWRYIS